MPKIPAILTILGVALTLTACTSSGSDPAPDEAAAASASTACTAPGAGSDAISVTGDFGVDPQVTFHAPVSATRTQRTLALAGTGGAKATAGSVVQVTLSAYNATTGKQFDSTGYGAEASPVTLAVDEKKYLPGLVRAVNCAGEGDRIVAVIPPKDAYGTAGNADVGIGATDSVVFVIDVNTVVPTRATGADQPAEAGLPAVSLARDGAPSITIPKAKAPDALKIATLKKGDGPVVSDGDTVTLEYTGVVWKSGKTFDSSWPTAGPATFATTDVVPGFGKALVGQSIGSQVLAIIPPAEGYGKAGQPSAGITGTDTLVFVVDVLATAPPAAKG